MVIAVGYTLLNSTLNEGVEKTRELGSAETKQFIRKGTQEQRSV